MRPAQAGFTLLCSLLGIWALAFIIGETGLVLEEISEGDRAREVGRSGDRDQPG